MEGTDGTGKTTQFRRLISKLRRSGFRVVTFDFPRYTKPSSYFVKEYLNGRYGGWREVGAYRASLFYALDRFDAAREIRRSLAEGAIVVANRYVASNMGHQGAKISGRARRAKFFQWLGDSEYKILGVPKPDLTLIFHVPASIAQKLVDKKGAREYVGGIKRDLHEADIKHLRRAEAVYLEIAKSFPRETELIECLENGKLLSVAAIHRRVGEVLKKRLKIRIN